MRLARRDLRDRLPTCLMLLTVLAQAELGKYFLLLYYAGCQLLGNLGAFSLLMLDTHTRSCIRDTVSRLDVKLDVKRSGAKGWRLSYP